MRLKTDIHISLSRSYRTRLYIMMFISIHYASQRCIVFGKTLSHGEVVLWARHRSLLFNSHRNPGCNKFLHNAVGEAAILTPALTASFLWFSKSFSQDNRKSCGGVSRSLLLSSAVTRIAEVAEDAALVDMARAGRGGTGVGLAHLRYYCQSPRRGQHGREALFFLRNNA